MPRVLASSYAVVDQVGGIHDLPLLLHHHAVHQKLVASVVRRRIRLEVDEYRIVAAREHGIHAPVHPGGGNRLLHRLDHQYAFIALQEQARDVLQSFKTRGAQESADIRRESVSRDLLVEYAGDLARIGIKIARKKRLLQMCLQEALDDRMQEDSGLHRVVLLRRPRAGLEMHEIPRGAGKRTAGISRHHGIGKALLGNERAGTHGPGQTAACRLRHEAPCHRSAPQLALKMTCGHILRLVWVHEALAREMEGGHALPCICLLASRHPHIALKQTIAVQKRIRGAVHTTPFDLAVLEEGVVPVLHPGVLIPQGEDEPMAGRDLIVVGIGEHADAVPAVLRHVFHSRKRVDEQGEQSVDAILEQVDDSTERRERVHDERIDLTVTLVVAELSLAEQVCGQALERAHHPSASSGRDDGGHMLLDTPEMVPLLSGKAGCKVVCTVIDQARRTHGFHQSAVHSCNLFGVRQAGVEKQALHDRKVVAGPLELGYRGQETSNLRPRHGSVVLEGQRDVPPGCLEFQVPSQALDVRCGEYDVAHVGTFPPELLQTAENGLKLRPLVVVQSHADRR